MTNRLPRATRAQTTHSRAALAVSVAIAAVATHPHTAAAIGAPPPGAVTARTLKLPDGPGSVRGLADHPQVDLFMGQIEYGVPIELPKGQAGLTPKLALEYHGALGNGPLGVGWAIPSVSIRRSLRLGVPAYTASDELELLGLGLGNKLVPVGDGTYRLFGRGQTVKVVPEGDGFAVWGPEGTKYLLGTSESSRSGSGERIAAWWVERVVTQSGAEIAYSYEHDAGQVYPKTISWGGDGAHSVEFVYEDRFDRVVSYRTGFRVETSRRIASIVVQSLGETTKTYTLSYDENLSLSRLVQVAVTGRGGTDSLPPLSFDYAAPAPQSQSSVYGAGTWVLNEAGVSLADIDGDGLNDLVMLDDEGYEYKRNLGGRFAKYSRQIEGGPSVGLSQLQLMDLTGNARPELVTIADGQWNAYRLENKSWQFVGTWGNTTGLALRGPGRELADLNGDGRTDSIRGYADGLLVQFNGEGALDTAVLRPLIDATNPVVAPGSENVRFGDVNGDGLADVMWLASEWITIYLGRGDGTFVHHVTQPYPWDALGVIVDTDEVRFPDLDRDGLADCVWFTAGFARWYRGKPNNTFESEFVEFAPPANAPDDVVIAISDINGNGSADLLWSWANGLEMLDLAGPNTAGMLAAIHNGLGKTVRIEYGPSSLLALYDELMGSPWTEKLPVSIPVPVRTTTLPGGSGPDRVVEYHNRDGYWDGAERRFGGFLQSTQVDIGATAKTTKYTETTYHAGIGDERALRGKPLEVRTRDGEQYVFSVTRTEWATMAIAGLPDEPRLRRAVVKRRVEERYEGGDTPSTTTTRFAHDSAGNVAIEYRDGLAAPEDDARVEYVYASDDATWVRDKAVEQKVYDANGALLTHRQLYYGDDTSEYEHGVVGRGWLRRERELLTARAPTSAHRWIDTHTIDYDRHGNAIRERTEGVLHHVTYDDRGLYPVEERVAPADGRELIWTMTWDESLAVPTAMTDPSGATYHVVYDGLGRPTSSSIGDAPAHVHYVYDWTAPSPHTYTYQFDGPANAIVPFTGSWTSDGDWRESIAVTNGAGEPLYVATRLDAFSWSVGAYTQRDERGHVARVTKPVEQAVPPIEPPSSPAETMTRDALGRILTKTAPSGGTRTYSYGARTRTQTVEDLAPITYLLDAEGRIVRAERTVNGIDESVDAVYDAAGRLLAMRIGDGAGGFAAEHTFVYDSLGRLVSASDPDIGDRTYRYNDAGWMVEQTNATGQSLTYTYDDAGRLTSVDDGEDARFEYHYDEALNAQYARTAGRLAWVAEPAGRVQIGYDEHGHRTLVTRDIGGRTATEATTYSPSGLVRTMSYDHELSLSVRYDAAGRTIGIADSTELGELWAVDQLDPSGRVVEEHFGNGVTQNYQRDEDGRPSRVTIAQPDTTPLYDVIVARNPWGALTTVADIDDTGLDHTSTFTYDAAARLVNATRGTGADTYRFGYRYDSLQNMTERTAEGPRPLGALTGTYRYAEPHPDTTATRGPRQLTSIVTTDTADGLPIAQFDYDAAGRQTKRGGKTLIYNGFDQLIRVEGVGPNRSNGSGVVEHVYGYDGLRVRTRATDGTEQIWFTQSLTERDGVRQHYVYIGNRIIARITQAPAATATPADASSSPAFGLPTDIKGVVRSVLLITIIAIIVCVFVTIQRRARCWRHVTAAVKIAAIAMLATAITPSCAGPTIPVDSSNQRTWRSDEVVYFHKGLGAGPSLLTTDDARIFEERRYTPFGVELDALRESPDGTKTTGLVDVQREPQNILNKRTDTDTGWSYHGARWMTPNTGRWLTPDPPTKAPDPTFMMEPWGLHPYQYVQQNPVVYWDPDGRDVASKIGRVLTWFDDSRKLTKREIAVVAPIFGKSINYKKVRIVEDSWTPGGRPFTVDSKIIMRGSPRGYARRNKSWDGTLVHEMGHVWQAQNSSFALFGYATKSLSAQLYGWVGLSPDAYDWTKRYREGIPFQKWNPESQAQLIEDMFTAGVFTAPGANGLVSIKPGVGLQLGKTRIPHAELQNILTIVQNGGFKRPGDGSETW